MRSHARLIRSLAACWMIVGFVAVGPLLGDYVEAQAPRANPPATKVELLFVQNGASGTFDGKTVTLKGVGPTLYFSDRPERIAGQLRTSDFVGHWTKGADNFAANPPNATLSVFGAKEVSSVVVVLTNPKLDGNNLSYSVKVLEGKLPASFKESSLFIDIFGRWRMAAMGMAVGEARGEAEARACSSRSGACARCCPRSRCSSAAPRGAAGRCTGARGRGGPDGQPGVRCDEAQGAQVTPRFRRDHQGSVPGGFPEAPGRDREVRRT